MFTSKKQKTAPLCSLRSRYVKPRVIHEPPH